MNRHDIQIVELTDTDFSAIDTLSQCYLSDLAQYAKDLRPDSDGNYDNSYFKLFFSEQGYLPLGIKLNGTVIGFALLHPSKSVDYVISDFFVSPEYRRMGIGSAAVEKLLETYPGTYGFFVLIENVPAVSFWRREFLRNGLTWNETEMESEMESDGEAVVRMISEYR